MIQFLKDYFTIIFSKKYWKAASLPCLLAFFAVGSTNLFTNSSIYSKGWLLACPAIIFFSTGVFATILMQREAKSMRKQMLLMRDIQRDHATLERKEGES